MKVLTYFILFLILGHSLALFSQNKKELSIEFNVNRAAYRMNSLNDYFKDDGVFSPIFYQDTISVARKINEGINYHFGINYNVIKCLSFGLYLDYNRAGIVLPLRYDFEPYPGYPDSNIVFEGRNKLKVTSFSAGLSAFLSLNNLFKFEKSKVSLMKNIELSSRFFGGVGTNSFSTEGFFFGDNNVNFTSFNSVDFHSKFELALGYRFGKKIFTTLGVKAGYQIMKSTILADSLGRILIYKDAFNPSFAGLDFSGFYYGIYLKISK